MEEKKLNSVENVNVVVENSTKEKYTKLVLKKLKHKQKQTIFFIKIF